MLSKTFVIAALAAAVTATPIAQGQSSYSAPAATGSYAATASYAPSSAAPAPAPTGATGPVAANLPAPTGLVAKLLTEPNTVNRFTDLQKELAAGTINLKFDFNPAANPTVTPGEGGQVDLAQRANFPILTGTGISAAGIFFNPCGLNTPHFHPRATEFLTLVTDTKMLSGFVLENGLAAEFNTTLTQFQGTVFPQGSIHFQQNLDCKPAVAIAGLNSEDPGASSVAQNFIVNLDPEIVDATLGFPKEINADNFAQFRKHIPASLAKGVEECLIRCHLAY
ncbi:uncharacterized protein A1O9_06654 [Exophiala aquamarina CBS 119918]|uniref:Cupin type-1 domain-containing protein n=1 Tax=Exophiala aquamarina CBS 119918 TaxID=1182545 RepID=A0A072PHF2_9EURO|nr:uncharacterized protein A1O9_06654 [Exophiala aquamarina CBS 119918]KEF58728.1 hypothetical protein A1O9_06654 [Exophiala aquamarina CBS 119918]